MARQKVPLRRLTVYPSPELSNQIQAAKVCFFHHFSDAQTLRLLLRLGLAAAKEQPPPPLNKGS